MNLVGLRKLGIVGTVAGYLLSQNEFGYASLVTIAYCVCNAVSKFAGRGPIGNDL